MDYRLTELTQALAKGLISEEEAMNLLKEIIVLQMKLNKVFDQLYDSRNNSVAGSVLTSPEQELKRIMREVLAEEKAGQELKKPEA